MPSLFYFFDMKIGLFLGLLCLCTQISGSSGLKILQIVPGYTNSHVLFNYRLATTLTQLGHEVAMFTQMEMNMVVAGDLPVPANITEYRLQVEFKDQLKTQGLSIFQTMMFNKGTPYDLWWTGQEFKDMRIDSCEQMLSLPEAVLDEFRARKFDIAISHFHDLCPLGLAEQLGVRKLVWITHGTSVYEYTAVQTGRRTLPSFESHPLTQFSDRMTFTERTINLLWHLSTLDFVNLPQNLLWDENDLYNQRFKSQNAPDLWDLSRNVRILLVNGERFLDFPKPFPLGIAFMGEVGKSKSNKVKPLPADLEAIVNKADKGLVIFSLGTVSNTTNMPTQMLHSFVEAFGQFPDYQILWRMEMPVPQASKYSNINLLKWLPQKDLMRHPKTKLLIAHGGYNSFLEASQAGIPIILMPLFADQFINAKRAKRFGTSEELDKLNLTPEIVAEKMKAVLTNPSYTEKAKKLASMLNDKPTTDSHAILAHRLKLAFVDREPFALKASQKLDFLRFYGLDFAIVITGLIGLLK